MKKKGFTLIELLAVIVVLAIIALIATPIVMNTIKKSQKGAAERSAENYIEAVETAVATSRLDSDGVSDGTYTINDKGNLEGNGLKNPLTIEMSGNKPSGGTITIRNGQVTTDSKMTIGSYEVSYNQTNKKYEATEKDSSSSTIVYRWSTDTIKIGDTIDPSDTSKFTKDPSILGKKHYLKHVLDRDNRVIESYACGADNNNEYCVRGGNVDYYGYSNNESDYTGNMLILKDLMDKGLQGSLGEESSIINVFEAVLLYAQNDGKVYSNEMGLFCYVNADGSSNCKTQ